MKGINPAHCQHPDFDAEVSINRLADTGKFMADVRVQCALCGCRFQFVGIPGGLDFNEPRVSPFGLELRVPIQPFDQPVPPQN